MFAAFQCVDITTLLNLDSGDVWLSMVIITVVLELVKNESQSLDKCSLERRLLLAKISRYEKHNQGKRSITNGITEYSVTDHTVQEKKVEDSCKHLGRICKLNFLTGKSSSHLVLISQAMLGPNKNDLSALSDIVHMLYTHRCTGPKM